MKADSPDQKGLSCVLQLRHELPPKRKLQAVIVVCLKAGTIKKFSVQDSHSHPKIGWLLVLGRKCMDDDFECCERDCGCGCDYHGHCEHYPEDVCCHCGADPEDEDEDS